MKALERAKTYDDDTEAYIMSIIKMAAHGGGKSAKIGNINAKAATPTLQSIIKRARNGGAGNLHSPTSQISSLECEQDTAMDSYDNMKGKKLIKINVTDHI